MENQGLLGFDTPQPPQPVLPKLRTFIVTRTNADFSAREQVTVYAHQIQPFSENGSIAFITYALTGNELTGTYTRLFNDWADIEEITSAASSIIH